MFTYKWKLPNHLLQTFFFISFPSFHFFLLFCLVSGIIPPPPQHKCRLAGYVCYGKDEQEHSYDFANHILDEHETIEAGSTLSNLCKNDLNTVLGRNLFSTANDCSVNPSDLRKMLLRNNWNILMSHWNMHGKFRFYKNF